MDGEGPYTYQWSRNGVPIPGARSWNYITAPATTSDNAAQYSVQVTGPANTISSSVATLTVTPQTLAVVTGESLAATCTTTLTVADLTAPIIVCPADIPASCVGTNGAVVTFTATATDNCDLNPLATCIPASGSTFGVGTNTVRCVAVDAAGNTNTCNFTITVVDPVGQPALTISRSGSDVLISWPQSCTIYKLEKTLELGPTADWSAVTGPVQSVGADYQISLPASVGNLFFGSHKQP